MDRAASGSDKYFHFGLASRRIEARGFSKAANGNELTITFAEKADDDVKQGKRAAENRVVWPNRTFHRHGEIEVVLVEKGRISHLIGGKQVRLEPGRLAAFWGAVPHTPVEVIPGTVYSWVTIPFSWFLEWQLPRAFTEAMLKGETLIERDDRDAPIDKAMFSRWHRDLRDGSADSRKIVLLECEARLRRLLRTAMVASGDKGRPAGAAQGSADCVERMTRFVSSQYTKPLRIADIADHVGLHPNYAATLFHKTCGISLLNYVKEHRIYHAQRLLATTDEKIVMVALNAGFGSASRFYCAFEKACGSTPRAYRRAMAPLFWGKSKPG